MKMRFLRQIVSPLSSLFLICCSGDYRISSLEQNSIEGTWEESFTWISEYPGIWLEDSLISESIDRTSRLRFMDGKFEVRISPPRRAIISRGDSVFSGFVDDTLFSGTYHIEGDTLFLNLNPNSCVDLFVFKLSHDTLDLKLAANAHSGEVEIFSMYHYIWANSFNKVAGKFISR